VTCQGLLDPAQLSLEDLLTDSDHLVHRKVNFDIHMDAIESWGLQLSSQLLRLTKVIHGSQRVQE
jgi:hypothetical protein